jgi:hypothetical protein
LAIPTPSGLILAGDALLDSVATQTVKGTIGALLQSEQGDLFAITAGHVVDDVLAACVRVPQSNHIIELERRWPHPDEEELDIREWRSTKSVYWQFSQKTLGEEESATDSDGFVGPAAGFESGSDDESARR